MAKVRRTDPPGPVHWALLSAARNEVESFQVHVRATTGLSAVTVEPSDLVDARSGGRIRAADHLTVSRQYYQHVPEALRSDANGLSGDVPDALVPDRDRYWGERRNAFPARVPAGENLSTWIDVLVPPGTPSGWYLGSVAVRDGGRTLATLPVRLKVWNFELPSTASLPTHFAMSWNGACVQEFGGYEGCGAATPSGSRDAGVESMHVLYSRFGLDRRVSIANVTYGPPRDDDWSHFDSSTARSLTARPDRSSPGPAPRFTYAARRLGTQALSRWARHFRERGWLDRLVFTAATARPRHLHVRRRARRGGAGPRGAPGLRTLLTTDIEQLHRERAPRRRGRGHAGAGPHAAARQAEPPSALRRLPLPLSPEAVFWYQSCDQHESCRTGRWGRPRPPGRATWSTPLPCGTGSSSGWPSWSASRASSTTRSTTASRGTAGRRSQIRDPLRRSTPSGGTATGRSSTRATPG